MSSRHTLDVNLLCKSVDPHIFRQLLRGRSIAHRPKHRTALNLGCDRPGRDLCLQPRRSSKLSVVVCDCLQVYRQTLAWVFPLVYIQTTSLALRVSFADEHPHYLCKCFISFGKHFRLYPYSRNRVARIHTDDDRLILYIQSKAMIPRNCESTRKTHWEGVQLLPPPRSVTRTQCLDGTEVTRLIGHHSTRIPCMVTPRALVFNPRGRKSWTPRIASMSTAAQAPRPDVNWGREHHMHQI